MVRAVPVFEDRIEAEAGERRSDFGERAVIGDIELRLGVGLFRIPAGRGTGTCRELGGADAGELLAQAGRLAGGVTRDRPFVVYTAVKM
jgi:hypothetical protein